MYFQGLIALLILPLSLAVGVWKARAAPAHRFWTAVGASALSFILLAAVLAKLGAGTRRDIVDFVTTTAVFFVAPAVFAVLVGRLCSGLKSKIAFGVIVVLAHLLALSAGVAIGPAYGHVALGSRWNSLEPSAAGFVVEMPGIPKCTDWHRNTATTHWTGHTCSVAIEPAFLTGWSTVSYAVQWLNIPTELEGRDMGEILRELRAPARESRSPVLARGQRAALKREEKYHQATTSHAAVLGGVHGVQYDSVPSASLPGFVSRERMCIHGDRLYGVLMAGGTNSSRERAWARMVESFQFVPSGG